MARACGPKTFLHQVRERRAMKLLLVRWIGPGVWLRIPPKHWSQPGGQKHGFSSMWELVWKHKISRTVTVRSSRMWRHNLRKNGRHKSQRWHVNHAAVWLCFPCGLCHRWMRASFWKKPATDISDNIFFCFIQNLAIDFDRLN